MSSPQTIYSHLEIKEMRRSLQAYASFNQHHFHSSDRKEDADKQAPKVHQGKYKTELCKNYSENGYCPYRNKCRFAHGSKELIHQRENIPNKKFKTKKCRSYWSEGFCSYGSRCQFQHISGIPSQTLTYLKIWKLVLQTSDQRQPLNPFNSRLI